MKSGAYPSHAWTTLTYPIFRHRMTPDAHWSYCGTLALYARSTHPSPCTVCKSTCKSRFQDSPRVLMKPPPSVCQSVCLSVCDKSSHTSHHQIFLIFCIKLAYYKRFKVTKPDFRKKNVLAQNWAKRAQNGPKTRFLVIFSRKNHQILLILHIMIEDHDIQQVVVGKVLKKISRPKIGANGPKTSPKQAQNEVFGHFLEKKSLDLADFT